MLLLIQIAVRNLLQARRRSALLSAAIAVVTAMLVLLLSIGEGIRDNLIDSATTLSAGHVSVAGFFKSTPSDASPIITDAARLRSIVEANTPGLAYVIDRHRGWAKVVGPAGTVQAGLSGVDLSQESRLLQTLVLAEEADYVEGGRSEVVGDPTRLAQPHTILLFVNQAKRLGVKVGDAVTVQTETRGGQTNTTDLTVVAVARDVGLLSSFALFVNRADILELYQLNADTTGALWVYLDDIDDAEAAMNHLRGVLVAEGYPVMEHQSAPFFFKFDTVAGEDWVGQKLDLTIWSDEVSFLGWVLTAFSTVTWFLTGILVVIIGVGILNTLWNAVRERTREMGTMRAIGMRRWQVLALVELEAVLLGAFATTLGALVGTAIALGIDAMHYRIANEAVRTILLSETLHLAVEPGSVAVAVVVLTLFTALSAAWPALHAARLSPVNAMQHVE